MKNSSGSNGGAKASKYKGIENNDVKGGKIGFGGKLFAGTRGFDPITIIMQIITL